MISVIIPVHNEEKILRENLGKIADHLSSLSLDYELVVIENGSSDNTLGAAEAAAKDNVRVKVLSIPEKDLGLALKKGLLSAKGEYIIWYPIDLSVGFSYIQKSLEDIRDYDIIVGSKVMKGAIDDRPVGRRMYSLFYNFLVNLLFNLHIGDTQCVKTFKRVTTIPIVEKVSSGGIVFEVELLYKSKKSGLRVKEVPVEVRDVRLDSKINFGVIGKAFRDLIRLRTKV
jgi:glycosyltransferase involved in cell wall biosynthesis